MPQMTNARLTVIGVAVSGGVDSMALAKLCSMLTGNSTLTGRFHFQFQAFIVDHGAREGSRLEAIQVKSNLMRFGTNTSL